MFGTQQSPNNNLGSIFSSHHPICGCHTCQGPNNDGFTHGPSTGTPGRFGAGVEQETKKPKIDAKALYESFKWYQGRLFESPCGRKMLCIFVGSSLLNEHMIIKCMNIKNFDEYTYNEETIKELTPLPEDPSITYVSVLADKQRSKNKAEIVKIDAQMQEHLKTIQEVEAKMKELEHRRNQLSQM
jgi:hypothetical protein